MGKLLKTIAALFFFSLLCSCTHKKILDQIVLINAIGFDYLNESKIEGTVVFPVYLPDQPPKNRTYTAKGEVKKTIIENISRQTTNPIVTGNLNIVLFSKELGEKRGILKLVDAFQRDPDIGSSLYLAVVDGKIKEFLEGDYGIRSTGELVSKLIEHNIKEEDLPKMNLQRFLFDYYQEGKTPYMPQLKQMNNDTVEISGIDLFKYGKIVDFIYPEELFFFKILVDKYSEGLHGVKIDEGEAAIRSIRTQNKFTLLQTKPFKIEVDIKVDGVINEFTGNKLRPETIKKMEKQFEKEITEECMKLIQRFKEKEVDPVGFGHFVKTQIRNFDKDDWNKSEYEELTVKIKTTVDITESGVIE